MIQVTEFRTGNYLLVDGAVRQLAAIYAKSTEDLSDPLIGYVSEGVFAYERSSSDRLQPVPLTDELLRQSGFSFNTHFHYWQKLKEVPGTGVDMELDRDHTAVDFSHRPILKEIQCLHHLQNLYFALRRKELAVHVPVGAEAGVLEAVV